MLPIMAQQVTNLRQLPAYGNLDIDHPQSKSVTSANGDIVTVGNIQTNDTRLYVHVQDAEGNFVWDYSWLPATGYTAAYGVDVSLNTDGSLAVAGVVTTGTAEATDVAVLKLDAEGVLLWERILPDAEGLLDLPIELVTATNGDVYCLGVSQSAAGAYGSFVGKLDGSNGATVWLSPIDDYNFEFGSNLMINASGQLVATTIVSGDLQSWRGRILELSSSTGAIGEQTMTPTLYFSPDNGAFFDRDAAGNLYLASTTGVEGMLDLRLTKYSPQMDSLWSVTYDWKGEDDRVTALTVGMDGGIYLGAVLNNPNGQRTAGLLRYSPLGTLTWEHYRRPESNSPIAGVETKGIATFSDGSVYLLANRFKQNLPIGFVVQKLNAQGKIGYEKRCGETGHRAFDVEPVGDQIRVGAVAEDTGETKYYQVKLEDYERSGENVLNAQNEPIYRGSELVVKFNRNYLRYDRIDDLDIVHADPAYWLTAEGYGLLARSIDPRQVKMIRIFKQLKTTHQYSTSRTGRQVPIRDFWSVFVLDFPPGTDLETVVAELEGTFPFVKYAHRNLIPQAQSPPNDPQYDVQHSLHFTPAYPATASDTVHINVEPFWEHETGRPEIKVGVFDNGIDIFHEDFVYGEQIPQSVVVGGYDYLINAPLISTTNLDQSRHGTACAGIIGAIRNNGVGIAGIAGGDKQAPQGLQETGVSMYGVKILGINDTEQSATTAEIADALVMSAIDNPATVNNFGLHIMSNSWAYPPPKISDPNQPFFNDFPEEVHVLREAVHEVNRNEAIFVASRGNYGNTFVWATPPDTPIYPASYDDPWVINVGSSGKSGGYLGTHPDDEAYRPNIGGGIDLVAPGEFDLVRTTDTLDTYRQFNGTSAAAPHVSGVAALLQSYLYNRVLSFEAAGVVDSTLLAPEDVEYILQQSATEVDTTGYDANTGFGRLNAGDAQQLVRYPKRTVHHYQRTPTMGQSVTVFDVQTAALPIEIAHPYENADNIDFDPAENYTAKIYRVETTVDHQINSFETILHSWERHSSSNLMPLVDNSGTLVPHERASLISVGPNTAVVKGYIYEVFDAQTGLFVGWIPFSKNLAGQQTILSYSVLVENSLINQVDDSELEAAINLYPNPTTGEVQLTFPTNLSQNYTVSIVDAFGKIHLQLERQRSPSLSLDCHHLAPGYYRVLVRSGSQTTSLPFVKQ